MPRITNWRRKNRTPTIEYRNTKIGARAVLHQAPDSYRYKWRGAVFVDGYPVWSRGYETKEATKFRDMLRERPAPELSRPECPNDDVVVGQKSADSANVQRWFDCPDCGYEGHSKIVYGAERWGRERDCGESICGPGWVARLNRARSTDESGSHRPTQ